MAAALDAERKAYYDGAVELFTDLKAQRYEPAGLGVVPTLMASANDFKDAYNNGNRGEVFRELGGERELKKFQYKLMAATNPIGYAQLKMTAMGEVKTATEAAFRSAFERFLAAGYSRDVARQMALQAAQTTMGVQQIAVRQAFGEDDTQVFQRALEVQSSHQKNPVAEAVAHGRTTKSIEHSGHHKKHKKHRRHKKQVAITID